MSGYSQLEPRL
jgi:hypothetical protein